MDARYALTAFTKRPQSGNFSEAGEALMVLGYDKSSVANALAGLDPSTDVSNLIRLALKKLSKN